MATQYKLEDLPMIMNSISWQLKRIADALEKDKKEESNPLESSRYEGLKRATTNPSIRSMLHHLSPTKD